MPRPVNKKPNKKYVIRLSENIGTYFEERAKATGQSTSAVMALALCEYLEQKKGIDAIAKFTEEMKKQNVAQKPETALPSASDK